MKEMFEHDRPASPEVQHHVDRCLSCLSCMTTCPSGVDYMHLVDHARAHIEETGSARLQGAHGPHAARGHPALSRPLPPRARGRRASPSPSRGSCAGSGSRSSWPCSSWRRPGLLRGADFTGPGTAATKTERSAARDPAGRLRPAGAAARDQRRHHPPAGAPRRRRRGGAGGRLLRGAGAPHGPGGRRASPSPSATSMPGRG